MDDDKANELENQSQSPPDQSQINQDQPQPVYETVPVDESGQPLPQDSLQPEEVASDVLNPEDAAANVSPELPQDMPVDGLPPAVENNRSKYLIIAGAVVFFVVIFILLIRLLIGGKQSTQNITLVYWGLWEDKGIMDPIINEYQQKNPGIKIDYQKMSAEDSYKDKLLGRSKNGQGPDLFRFHNTWMPELKDLLAALPSTVMSNQDFEKTFYPIHAKDLKVGQNYYGIPLEIDGLVLIYNYSLFKNGGLTKAPADWDEALTIVNKLSVKDKNGQVITSGIALGTTKNVEHFSEIFGLLLVQNGGTLTDLTKPEAEGALQIYRSFAEPPTDYWNDMLPNSIAAFAQEKVAMIIAPSWEILSIHTQNPEIDLKVAPLPNLPGTNPISLASYWVEGVSKYSKAQNQLEAWKFLKYLSEKETVTKLYEAQKKTRLFGEPYSRKDLQSTIINDPYIGVVVQQADSDKYYFSLPLVARTFDNGLNDQIIDYIRNAINQTADGVSYSEALKQAQAGVTQVLSRYGLQ